MEICIILHLRIYESPIYLNRNHFGIIMMIYFVLSYWDSCFIHTFEVSLIFSWNIFSDRITLYKPFAIIGHSLFAINLNRLEFFKLTKIRWVLPTWTKVNNKANYHLQRLPEFWMHLFLCISEQSDHLFFLESADSAISLKKRSCFNFFLLARLALVFWLSFKLQHATITLQYY